MIPARTALIFIRCCLAIAACHSAVVFAQAPKVDVCHIPPGNPENAHTITISENALATHLDHGDQLGPCEPTETVGIVPEPAPEPVPVPVPVPVPETEPLRPELPLTACTCPRAGVWQVTNHEGWMECQPFGIKRTDKREDKNDGAIWILNDDCSTIFSEAYEKQREDVIMDRGRDCLFFGAAPGEEDGAQVIFDGAYKVETEEFITGEYFMEMSSAAISCTGYSPFQIDFLRPLNEKDYAKLEKTMQKELEKARKVLDEHQEQIEAYLEKTNGGKPYGGRNGQQ